MGLLDSLASSLDVDEDDLDSDAPFGFEIVEEQPTNDAALGATAGAGDDDADADRGASADGGAAADDDADGPDLIDVDPDAAAPATDSGDEGRVVLRNDRSDGDWVAADAPTSETLFGVVQTVRGPVAVGTDGLVLGRGPAGWERLVERGPAARSNTLFDADVTDDGERVWFAGSSGALGMYDVVDRRKYDFSAPMEKTSTWESIAVAGSGEEARLLVANGSGEVVGAAFDENGRPRFGDPTEPGGGSTLTAVDVADGVGYACDTSGGVYRLRTDEWERIGIREASVDFRDVLGTDDGRLLVAADDGLVYRYDHDFERWTPLAVGTTGFHAIDDADGRTVVVGDAGAVHQRTEDADWRRVPSPVSDELLGVALGPLDVAVGEDGTVVERTAGVTER
jgi:hypothetical protein